MNIHTFRAIHGGVPAKAAAAMRQQREAIKAMTPEQRAQYERLIGKR